LGPFTLAEGYSTIENTIAVVSGDPFTCTWLFTGFPRSDHIVLEANTDHWNTERGPRLERRSSTSTTSTRQRRWRRSATPKVR
jgi:hypothetical protein